MLLKKLHDVVSKNVLNSKGKSVTHKLVVLESDDWGTIRMASKQDYQRFLNKNPLLDQCYFSKNDMLESNEDLMFLMETLGAVKGSDGLPAKITMNNIVANPDFEKIKANDFQQYYFEPFTKTLHRYPNHDRVIEYYKEGLENKIFQVQFHGREHVHVSHWMSELQKDNKYVKEVFDSGMFSIFRNLENSTCNGEFQNGMAAYSETQHEFISKSIIEGTELFEDLWGFKSKSVIAPCYNWHPRLEEVFNTCGISLIQGGRVQLSPSEIDGVNYPITHYFGELNNLKQTYLIRNVYFEPTTNPSLDWVDKALLDISIAFLWKKPALISTHRLNYIGGLVSENRDKNLVLLKTLLEKIVRRWPDVKFISTDEIKNYFLA